MIWLDAGQIIAIVAVSFVAGVALGSWMMLETRLGRHQ